MRHYALPNTLQVPLYKLLYNKRMRLRDLRIIISEYVTFHFKFYHLGVDDFSEKLILLNKCLTFKLILDAMKCLTVLTLHILTLDGHESFLCFCLTQMTKRIVVSLCIYLSMYALMPKILASFFTHV